MFLLRRFHQHLQETNFCERFVSKKNALVHFFFSQTLKHETCSTIWNRKNGNWKFLCTSFSWNRSGNFSVFYFSLFFIILLTIILYRNSCRDLLEFWREKWNWKFINFFFLCFFFCFLLGPANFSCNRVLSHIEPNMILTSAIRVRCKISLEKFSIKKFLVCDQNF